MTLEVRNVSKRYGPNFALREVSFAAEPGVTLAVLGANGAGKSTLVNIIAGAARATSGELLLGGDRVDFGGPRDAVRRGITLIPQELAYLPNASVAENIRLGEWTGRRLIGRRKLFEQAQVYASDVGLEVDLALPMQALSLAQRQLVEIAKALSRNTRVLLLDEPTAALTKSESDRLFEILQRLKSKGVIVLYISHRLDEIMDHADRVLVLRDGRVVSTDEVRATTKSQIILDMVGQSAPPDERVGASAAADGDADNSAAPVTSLQEVTDRYHTARDVSFDVAPGEVVTLFGVLGAGHEAIARVLVGLNPHRAGTIMIGGTHVAPIRSPLAARKLGVTYVPPERKRQGLLLDQSVRQNLMFPNLKRAARRGIALRRLEREFLRTTADRLALKYRNPEQMARQLSGGNQQKLMLAARLNTEPRVLVLEEPTRGVDVEARRELHRLIREEATRLSIGVVAVTTDVDEAVELSDRILVFRDGRVADQFRGGKVTAERLLAAAGQRSGSE